MERIATKQMRGKSVDTLDWMTPEGIKVKPLYTAEDLENMDTNTLPGGSIYAWTHGHHVCRRPWTIRQYAGFSTAKESNAFYQKASGGRSERTFCSL